MIVTAAVVLFAFFLFSLWFNSRDDWYSAGWTVATFVSGFVLLFALLSLLVVRANAATNRAEIRGLTDTIRRARSAGRDPLESAAINLKIAEANGWIATAKYWNGTAFDPFWPDWVDDLHPVE